jgi:hypothetical protein
VAHGQAAGGKPAEVPTFSPKAASDGWLLAKTSPRGDFEIVLEITCEKSGSVLDTIGLNAAPVGSWNVTISGDNHLTFSLWDGRKWYPLVSQAALSRGKAAVVKITRQGSTLRFSVDGKKDGSWEVSLPLAGTPVYVGDFKGDEGWGPKYNIYQGFLGTVRVLYFGDLRVVKASQNPPVADSPPPVARTEKRELASVVVSSEPTDGEVLVNGLLVGTTPVMLKLPDGVHVIELIKPGYVASRKELRVYAGMDSALRVKLQPQAAGSAPAAAGQ